MAYIDLTLSLLMSKYYVAKPHRRLTSNVEL
jgi:hypothetical protein